MKSLEKWLLVLLVFIIRFGLVLGLCLGDDTFDRDVGLIIKAYDWVS